MSKDWTVWDELMNLSPEGREQASRVMRFGANNPKAAGTFCAALKNQEVTIEQLAELLKISIEEVHQHLKQAVDETKCYHIIDRYNRLCGGNHD